MPRKRFGSEVYQASAPSASKACATRSTTAASRSGWRVYAALVLAGVATNLLALVSRAAPKLVGIDIGRPFDSWWLQASVTYTLSGVVAGLFGALCWFHFNDRAEHRPPA